jgi:ubiquinone/menaquinone biosynthesis C-methylase UbiE
LENNLLKNKKGAYVLKTDGKFHKSSLKKRYDLEYVWYDKTRSSWMNGYTGKVEQEIFLSTLHENLILEIGTGTGRYASLLKNREYVGIDLNRKMLNEARKRTRGDYIVAEAETLPFRDGVFNNVMCSRTFRFIQNPSNTLNEALRVIKKGKNCIVSVDFLRDFYGYAIAQRIHGKYPYETHYRISGLIDLFKNAGFKVEKVRTPFALPESTYQRIPRFTWRFTRKIDCLLGRLTKGWFVVIVGKKP